MPPAGATIAPMRALFALMLVPIALGALALAGSPAHQRTVPRARLLSASSACSAASACVKGCALPVAAGAPRAQRTAPSRSPASPCAKQAQGGCLEYVAARPGTRGEAACIGASPAFGERLLSPRALRGLRQRSERALRKYKR